MLTDSDRNTLDALLDQIIPPDADRHIPGAGELGVAEFLLGVAAADADFASRLREGLDLAGGDAGRLEATAPESFAAIRRQAYMGYYSRPDTRVLFGVSARPVHPLGYEVPGETEDFLSELTAPVVARGRCYRAV